MGWWLKNRVEIEIMVFLLIGVGLLTGVGSPTPWSGGGECLVTITAKLYWVINIFLVSEA
jgi:hypothetical protein